MRYYSLLKPLKIPKLTVKIVGTLYGIKFQTVKLEEKNK